MPCSNYTVVNNLYSRMETELIVCFESSSRTKTQLDSLIESGQYKDYSEAISSALENLIVLQNELSGRGALIIESAEKSASLRSQQKSGKASRRSKMVQRTKRGNVKKYSTSKAFLQNVPTQVPEIFLLGNIGKPFSSPANPPGDVWTMGQNVPLERWIFGQYNRLLPVKASCRAFANLLNGKPNGVALDEAASRISEEALTLGSFLAHRDKQNGTKRDEALSTAFPSLDREIEKSRLRYANQFVASINKQGKVSGLLMDLKLINHTGTKNPRLKLTEAGWGFAKLRNPVFDGDTLGTTQKFTAEERSFLLNHISSSVPAEDFAYRTILVAVDGGAQTPEKLDAALREHVSQNAGRGLTKSFLASQRSGAVSRMADLELITRERDGVKVFYVVTDLGKQYTQDKVIPLQRRKHIE
jgi:Arc/MetJ-type ribon-helix-helix transcriptional regulator